ncbi:MAG: DUF362 domain-containing protein [Candidatus Bathyarchaeota archaeon]|nr:DUF362 domain-containing protein [Candidatus Bathyarchaeota archaeon]
MGETIVSIVKVGDVSESVEEAVELAGGLGVKEGDVVVVKPNAKNPSPSGYGIITDPSVVEACVSLAFKQGAKKVKIADGAAYPTGAYDTIAAFQASGIAEVARRWDVELVDLNSYDSLDVDVRDGYVLDWVRVGRSVMEADVVINVPVLKTHRGTLLSSCLKNVGVGCATREEKKRLHRLGIDEGLVDVYSIVRPRFNVVDGIVALEGDGPNLPPGRSKPLGLIVAGSDGLAVDVVCAKIMGIDPNKVKHLRLAKEKGLGVMDPEEIEVKGESIERVATQFELPSTFRDI